MKNYPTHLSSSELWLAHAPTAILIAWYLRHRWWCLLRFPLRTRHIWFKLCCWGFGAECVTALLYAIFKYVAFPMWCGFLITACLFISTKWCSSSRTIPTWQHYLVIGAAQGVAALPGLSRLACTYVIGRWCGLSPAQSFDISWTLAWPLYAGAAFLGYCMIDTPWCDMISPFWLVITMIIAAIFFYAVKKILIHRSDLIFASYLIIISYVAYTFNC